MVIDPENFFRNKIDNMLLTASWVEEVREGLGLTAVSQIWDEKPSWYFWVSGFHGAYQLQLESTCDDESAPAGIFSIKYYPSPRDSVFPAFSEEERSVVQSPLFDHTNTPRYEKRARIPAHLFNLATVFFSTPADDHRACLSFQALKSLRVADQIRPEISPLGAPQRDRIIEGKMDRKVPSWELGYALFERVAGLYAFYSKNTPVRILLGRSPGFELVSDGMGGLQCFDTPDIHVYNLSVFFGANGQDFETSGTSAAEWMVDDDQETLFDHPYDPKENPASGHWLPWVRTTLNPSWWTLAHTHYRSSLASTCGCEHDHGTSCHLSHREGE